MSTTTNNSSSANPDALHRVAGDRVYDIDEVRRLLVDEGHFVDSRDGWNRTPLMGVVPYSQEEMKQGIWKDVAELLLEHGADVNAVDSDGTTVLHQAARRRNWDVVKFLVGHKANVNATDKKGRVPMYLWFDWNFHCPQFKNDEQKWLNLGANCSLLHLAAGQGDYEMAQYLLKDGGADADAIDSEGMTPLHHLAKHCRVRGNRLATLAVLLVRFGGANVHLVDKQGCTPLHYIAEWKEGWQYKELEKVTKELVIKGGADVNVPDHQGQVPLHYAIASGHFRMVELLVGQGADINVATNGGETVLHLALKHGREDLVRLLVNRGANVAAVDDQGLSTFLSSCISGAPYPLHRAAEAWDLDEIRNLLESGEHEVDSRDNEGRTPLLAVIPTSEPCLKVQDNWRGVATCLLEHGANVNAADNNGETVLHRAARIAHHPCQAWRCEKLPRLLVDWFVQHGADVHATNINDRTPLFLWLVENPRRQSGTMAFGQDIQFWLRQGANGSCMFHVAARRGDYVMAEMLLNEDISPDVNMQDSQGMTPMHHALEPEREGAKYHLAKLLLQRGPANVANVQLADNRGRTPLRMALSRNRPGFSFVSLFVRHINVHSVDSQGKTPLHCVLEYAGNQKRGIRLVDRGADINAATNQGETVLHVALKHGRKTLARLLLNRGAGVNAVDNQGQTAFHHAATRGYIDVTELLLNRGAVANVTDNQGETVLHVAVKHGRNELARLLVDRGANINAATNRGETVLHFALQFGQHELARLLVDQGAGVNAVDNQGRTTLHHAAAGGNIYVTELLLNQGAIANVTGNQGQVPLHCAATGGHVGVVEHLLCRGGGISASDNQGHTPLFYAATNNHHDTAHLLLLSGCMF